MRYLTKYKLTGQVNPEPYTFSKYDIEPAIAAGYRNTVEGVCEYWNSGGRDKTYEYIPYTEKETKETKTMRYFQVYNLTTGKKSGEPQPIQDYHRDFCTKNPKATDQEVIDHFNNVDRGRFFYVFVDAPVKAELVEKINPTLTYLNAIKAVREFTGKNFTTGTVSLKLAKSFVDDLLMDAANTIAGRDYAASARAILLAAPFESRKAILETLRLHSPNGLPIVGFGPGCKLDDASLKSIVY